jgi:hypothetical protein
MSNTTFQEAAWSNTADAVRPAQGKLVVMFRNVQKKNAFESKRQNRPVFVEMTHIVKIPADQFLKIDRPVTQEDIDEFPLEWERWEKTKETRVLGTPLDMWHAITDTQKAEFRAMNVFTVEQFANLSDTFGAKIMGFNELRKKAQVFVESGKDAELVSRIREEANAEVTAMRKELEELKAMMKKGK